MTLTELIEKYVGLAFARSGVFTVKATRGDMEATVTAFNDLEIEVYTIDITRYGDGTYKTRIY